MSKKYYDRLSKTSGLSSKAFSSDFGRKVLESYGWKEGEGLGRNREGRVDCIQVTRREDKMGLGLESKDTTKDWDNWWAACFNSVAKKISVGNASAKVDSDSSEEEDEHKQSVTGSTMGIKSAKVQQGKVRRVLRMEAGTPASPGAESTTSSTKRSLPEDADLGPSAKRTRD
eukprot:gnl/MRDRNA2_/MRDRNA2_32609_c0_seq1.p2 gnl/MRDRNA2_/MRDRNA2_32609_c0~~gnl/MRDRNA2_/MRDRNA2_32609_c0_seq1.p2  ORF type:complete len:172 (-),score=49.76 gnl/MRDRNA2_/MRDRNA2_32609_c0_seq1:104-619(-)